MTKLTNKIILVIAVVSWATVLTLIAISYRRTQADDFNSRFYFEVETPHQENSFDLRK